MRGPGSARASRLPRRHTKARTAQTQLALPQRIDAHGRRLDQLGCQLHHADKKVEGGNTNKKTQSRRLAASKLLAAKGTSRGARGAADFLTATARNALAFNIK